MPTTVTPRNGHYLVTVVNERGVRVYTVTKKKECTCRHWNCEHVKAVAEYLKAGGRAAPDREVEPPWVEDCPVCGRKTHRNPTWPSHWWECPGDRSHYFQWQGEVGGVREFLTANHDPGREDWLKSLPRTEVW